MNNNQIFSAFLISLGLFGQSCGTNTNKSEQAGGRSQAEVTVPVTTVLVNKEIVSGTKSYPANVVPLQETEIRAEVSGYITNIYTSDGAYVSKGQRLYEIDRTRYKAATEQAEANLAIAKANLDRVQKDLERYQTLAKQDAIARQTLDYAMTDLNNQKAQVQAAEAALTTARTNLQRSVIVAPFSGNIGISQVRQGALVSAGSTLLNTISSTDPIAVEFQINEKDITEFNALQRGASQADIYVTLPDGNRFEGVGHISTIDRAVDSQTGTIKVRASFANASNALRAGMNATLNIQSASKQEELIIPYKAVFEQLGTFNVYTVNDSSKVELKQVSLGAKIDDRIVVTSGLEAGQKIVTEGATALRPGFKVTENNQ
ncbi:efflux RND transporter periplasmic adaptor subunit [Sphingobacterium sp. SGG-5]|uniref:efflux RND transporter periplasmic adaptor subunit n=1 Tax=Sphingobacterium sp. SGG-5 TaxID=2710881 RepID=UPI0013EB0236|nr:efflux RND transporter periplasmic adaptor subunit [Sphingobacterium sp. SGG-5]NGM62728.1 efflux RND transporter periplasmic adaptor subunit [Sphingobacterium sp. SGG-5]